ncbi:MAG: hypothetical protein OQK00_10150 [Rhodobacteraceae bacterium]|nr:hypothetical protein [Paracoccaceae bacterium]
MKRLHPIAGGVALAMISVFWVSTVVVELRGNQAQIAQVKILIPWGFLILVSAMAAVGCTGFRLGQTRRGKIVDKKRKRMPLIATNGVLILIPAAFFLASKAQAGAFDAVFYGVQVLELAAGAVNIMLLWRNMRDGRRLVGKPRRFPGAG